MLQLTDFALILSHCLLTDSGHLAGICDLPSDLINHVAPLIVLLLILGPLLLQLLFFILQLLAERIHEAAWKLYK